MDKNVNSIKINKLSCSSNIFDPIVFHDGINLILGEKGDLVSRKGKKTNGVGKSMVIEFIDFCFLNDYSKSRVKLIPDNVFPKDEMVHLDLTIGNAAIRISRSRHNEKQPIITKNSGNGVPYTLDDARNYIQDLVFSKLDRVNIPSLRSLLSILIRDENSEFIDIVKCHDLTQRIPDDLSIHLFLLHIDVSKYEKIMNTIKELGKITTVIASTKKDLTENGKKNISNIKAELNALEAEIKIIDKAIDQFRTAEAFDMVQNDLMNLDTEISKYRKEIAILRSEYKKIQSMPKPESIDDTEIELVYNQFKKELGSMIVKTLREVSSFKDKVDDFQRTIINVKAQELLTQIDRIADQIKFLDARYSEKMKLIDSQGVLQNLKTGLKIYEEKKAFLSRSISLYDEYERKNKDKKELDLSVKQTSIEIDDEIDNKYSYIADFNQTILDIHEYIMGNRECSFEVNTADSVKSKTPVNIYMRIRDDGSRSVNRTKVFIYDVGLLFNSNTRLLHPLFLVHDNIFDVDQDTLVQSLNYLAKQEGYQDFQYILTLNRDKIENEERQAMLDIKVEDKKVASFTKFNKFLKNDYQEL
ncbi:MAG: DUF2326 domain-containing protein [Patescibacteria group bacterium]